MIRLPAALAEKLPHIEARARLVAKHGEGFARMIAADFIPFIVQAKLLAGRYDCVVANPPYMGSKYYERGLKEFVNDPHVTVIIETINSYRVYILGHVLKAGVFTFQSPTRLAEALATAQGFDQFADVSHLVVLSSRGTGAQTRIEVDWKKIVSLFWDRARMSRTDGALVRFTLPVVRGDEAKADAAFHDLAQHVVPLLPSYVPN